MNELKPIEKYVKLVNCVIVDGILPLKLFEWRVRICNDL